MAKPGKETAVMTMVEYSGYDNDDGNSGYDNDDGNSGYGDDGNSSYGDNDD